MFSQDQQPCDSVEEVVDGRKTKTRTATKAPAATTLPTASDQCFEHSNQTTPYQHNVAASNFNAGRAASMMTTCDACSLFILRRLRIVRFTYGVPACWCFITLSLDFDLHVYTFFIFIYVYICICSLTYTCTSIHIKYISRIYKPTYVHVHIDVYVVRVSLFRLMPFHSRDDTRSLQSVHYNLHDLRRRPIIVAG